MAFNVKVQSLGKYKARLTANVAGGSKIAHGTSLKIGFNGDATADVQLPATFPAQADNGRALADIVSVHINKADNAATSPGYQVAKGGAPFQIVLTNNDAANDGGDLEILVVYEHTLVA